MVRFSSYEQEREVRISSFVEEYLPLLSWYSDTTKRKVLSPVPGRDINTGTDSSYASQWALLEQIYLEAPRSADIITRIKVLTMCKFIYVSCLTIFIIPL